MKVTEIITEAANPAQQAAIAISMKKVGKKPKNESTELEEEFDLIESIINRLAAHNGVDAEVIWEDLETLTEDELYAFAVTSEPIMESYQKGEYGRVLDALGLYYPRISMEELNTPGYYKVIANKADVPVEYAAQVIDGFVNDDRYYDNEDDEEQGMAEGADDKFSVADKVEELVDQYRLYDKRGWTDLFTKLAGRKLEVAEIRREMEYASKFLDLLDSIRMRSDYRGQQDPRLDQELIDLSNQWLGLFNKATGEFKGMSGQGVMEGGAKDRQWSNKDMERLRVATRDFDDIMASDGPEATKQNLIKKRIQKKPMAGPKGVLPEQGVAEDWQKANKRDKTDGMSQKAVNAYRRENPGSKLKTAVTTKPGKLKKGGKASKRRKSYCSRSRGQMKMHSISCAKTPDKAICKARRRWNC